MEEVRSSNLLGSTNKMDKITPNLIAPCGMNCGLCLNHLRAEKKCPGCFSGRKVNNVCIKCAIKLCKERQGDYCYECEKFPCERLGRLDKRYKEKYGMSEIDNLVFIRDKGMKEFLKSECKKWQSDQGTMCVHDKKYY
jgi:hypothetical protein